MKNDNICFLNINVSAAPPKKKNPEKMMHVFFFASEQWLYANRETVLHRKVQLNLIFRACSKLIDTCGSK